MDPVPNLSAKLENLSYRHVVEKDRLIIGLDFGTTFSGIAYAFTTDPEQVFAIDMWPGANDKKVPKAPTIIKYENGSKTNYKWGYELDQTLADKIEGIKLLLDPDQERPLYAPDNTQAEIAKLGKPVIEVATDYIRAIYQHSLRQIEQSFLADYIKDYEKQYVLSVPAMWTEKAQDATQRAARNAGIQPIDLIKEPEAAALYTLHFNQNKGLAVGDAIVICDAGGGTVDLISYEIVGLNPLELKELTKCSGGLAGSLMLNKRFEQWIQTTVGDSAFVELKQTAGFRSAMQQFDSSIKPGFRSKDDPDKYISFPMAKLKDNPSRGVVRNSITVKGTTLFNVFDPLFRDIDKLVTEQVNQVRIKRLTEQHPKGAAVKAIFLVGGFGSSAYLKQSIEASHTDIQVLQPPDAWSAIVKGAVMSKLPREAVVLSNIAAKHYGTSHTKTYDPVRDHGRTHWTEYWEGKEKCEVMSWFIQKDDELVREEKLQLRVYRRFGGVDPSGDELRIQDELFESTARLAPTYPDDGESSCNAHEALINCTLHTDLNKVPKHHFVPRTRRKNGENYCELSYTLLIEVRSGPMKFSLEIDGEEYSAVSADY